MAFSEGTLASITPEGINFRKSKFDRFVESVPKVVSFPILVFFSLRKVADLF